MPSGTQILTVIFVHRTCLVQDRTSSVNVSGIRWKDWTSLVDRTCFGTGPTGLTGRTDFSTLLKFGLLTSLLESFWILTTLVLPKSPCCIHLYSTMTYTQERNKTHKNKIEFVNLIILYANFRLCLSLRVSKWSWLEQLCLDPMIMNFFDLYN
jgi:hypothetical protein